MALIGQAVSERKIFENGGRRTDDGDGRTTDHGHPISSPCEPNGSGELKIDKFVCKYIEDIQVFGVNMSFISLSEVKKFYIS